MPIGPTRQRTKNASRLENQRALREISVIATVIQQRTVGRYLNTFPRILQS